jgi:hypothetical protein
MESPEVIYLKERLTANEGKLILKEREDPFGNYSEKCNIINDIISIRKLLLQNGVKNNAYSDVKKFLIIYIKQVDERDFEYDKISINVVRNKIDFFTNEERIQLLNYFYNNLQKNGYQKESEDCKKELAKENLIYYKNNLTLTNTLKIIAQFSSKNIFRLLFSIVLFFIITLLILSPAPFESMKVLHCTQASFSSKPIINHILNVISLFLDFDNGMEVTALGVKGVLLIVAGKIIFITILLNYFARKFIEKISISE